MDGRKEKNAARINQHAICPKCNARVPKGNFCAVCAYKIVKSCDCWILNRAFDCGHNECPGYHLIVEKIKKAKSNI